MAKFKAEPGCPFPIARGSVPLWWFVTQGASPELVCHVLASPLIAPDNLRGQTLPLSEAWDLLDELIHRNAFPGPIRPYVPEPLPPPDLSPFADFWR